MNLRQAREVQTTRFKGKTVVTNSAMDTRLVREHCKLGTEANAYLEQAMEQLNFSARVPQSQKTSLVASFHLIRYALRERFTRPRRRSL